MRLERFKMKGLEKNLYFRLKITPLSISSIFMGPIRFSNQSNPFVCVLCITSQIESPIWSKSELDYHYDYWFAE